MTYVIERTEKAASELLSKEQAMNQNSLEADVCKAIAVNRNYLTFE